jgi:hypothetical protein
VTFKFTFRVDPVGMTVPYGTPTAADAIEDEVHEVLAICEGDAVAALRITLIANAFLKAEIDRLSAALLSGFARGKVRNVPRPKEAKEKNTHGRCADC